jgi:hypothetical protein
LDLQTKKAGGLSAPGHKNIQKKTVGPSGGAHGLLVNYEISRSWQARPQFRAEPPPISLCIQKYFITLADHKHAL